MKKRTNVREQSHAAFEISKAGARRAVALSSLMYFAAVNPRVVKNRAPELRTTRLAFVQSPMHSRCQRLRPRAGRTEQIRQQRENCLWLAVLRRCECSNVDTMVKDMRRRHRRLSEASLCVRDLLWMRAGIIICEVDAERNGM